MPRLSGATLIEHLGFDSDGVVVIKKPFPRRGLYVGSPVPLVDRSPEPPEYRLLGVSYPAIPLIRALKSGDPTPLDVLRKVRGARAMTVSQRDLRVLELAQAGHTYVEIGAMVGGVKRQRVKQILDRLANLGHEVPDTLQVRRLKRAELLTEAVEGLGRPSDAGSLRAEAAIVRRIHNKCSAAGIPFDLEPADLHPLPTHCPVLGIPLDYNNASGRGVRDRFASVDRIDPKRGYTKGNVIVVSVRANRIKNDATPAELRKIADFYDQFLLT